ncbi:MAG: sarco/endoplasmic reticulum calcium-translocating P-type ATPase/golgi membrane [Bacillota bacterium]|nr:MAG: sarco/endoplasmic reticulum calcium-translocating P-type ATPase/golgi membrane [Bacillota bacterium]
MSRKYDYHSMSYTDVLQLFRSSTPGLTPREAEDRLEIYGHNRLAEKRRPSAIRIFLAQFKDLMTLILLGATLVSGLLGEYADAATIIAIVLLNACLGLIQEIRAEKAMAALKELAAPVVTVRRGGQEQILKAEYLVPGDIVLLTAGDRIPADMRLGHTSAFEVEEAALTGESLPVKKSVKEVAEQAPLPERRPMVYFGTMVTKGNASGVVVATGMETEVGRIAELLQTEQEPTPLQNRLSQLGKYIVAACLLVCSGVVALGIMRGEPVHHMLLAGVSLAVAAIPEGLPAIVTIVLALGVQRISKVNALVRRLPAVETLGSATVICSDKTGTLTCNQMTVREIYVAGHGFVVTGDGLNLRGEFRPIENSLSQKDDSALKLALRIGAVCNNSKLTTGKFISVIGDPTEGALIVAARKAQLELTDRRLGEVPFDSARKTMSVVIEDRLGKRWLFTKGAPDTLLTKCSYELSSGKRKRLSRERLDVITGQNEHYASRGLRVLGLAYREYNGDAEIEKADLVEQDLTFVGLIAMQDPPRPEAKDALSLCQLAGIRVIMITGDHALTALAIAKEIGMTGRDGRVVLGSEIANLSEPKLRDVVAEVNIYARVSPEHKLRIVRALRHQGHVVAMTGDGINDAPALKEADIGVSMGQCGTEVAREASSLVLQDDNFATVVEAVREGRGIYDNIRKFIRYLLACNVGELLSVFIAMSIALPLPLRPMQILWVNLVTDGLPAMALGVDIPDAQIMLRPPRLRNEGIFSRGLARKIISRGVLIGISTALVFGASLQMHGDLARAQTMAFGTLVLCQLFHVFDCRSEVMGVAEKGILTNPLLLASVGLSLVLVLVSIYVPFLQGLFGNVPLDLRQWVIIVLASGLPSIIIGMRRAVLYRVRR